MLYYHYEMNYKAQYGYYKRSPHKFLGRLMKCPNASYDRQLGLDFDGSTPLGFYICYGNHNMVKWLIEVAGADINYPDSYGRTPLMRATYMNDTEIINYLMTHGANLFAKDNSGKIAIDYARGCDKVATGLSAYDILDKYIIIDSLHVIRNY